MLEDVVDGFQKPCVLDLKIGAITWNPDASPSKIHAEKVSPNVTSPEFTLHFVHLIASKSTWGRRRHWD